MNAWWLGVVLGFALVTTSGTPPSGTPFIAAHEMLLDINEASAAELARVPGIGPQRAAAIVALREKQRFTRLTQLLQVKGIGKKTLARLRSRLVVRTLAPRQSD